MASRDPAPLVGVDALAEDLFAFLDERLRDVRLTPGERAEAACIALGVGSAVSAAARGVSASAVRASRRRLRRKLEQALAFSPGAGADATERAGDAPLPGARRTSR